MVLGRSIILHFDAFCKCFYLSRFASISRLGLVIGAYVGEFRALREYTHTLRLKSELFDLRVGYANSNNASGACIVSSLEAHGSPITKGTAIAVPFVIGDPWASRDETMQAPLALLEFAYPTRRSKSSLFRRRVWVYSRKARNSPTYAPITKPSREILAKRDR